jgi:uncharacterized protein YlzI (FlbEa/FlbD family)
MRILKITDADGDVAHINADKILAVSSSNTWNALDGSEIDVGGDRRYITKESPESVVARIGTLYRD